MPMFFVRMILRQLLGSEEVKAKVFTTLKALVDDPTSDFDEKAIGVAEDVWDALVPVLTGRL